MLSIYLIIVYGIFQIFYLYEIYRQGIVKEYSANQLFQFKFYHAGLPEIRRLVIAPKILSVVAYRRTVNYSVYI